MDARIIFALSFGVFLVALVITQMSGLLGSEWTAIGVEIIPVSLWIMVIGIGFYVLLYARGRG